jgi:CHAT domain
MNNNVPFEFWLALLYLDIWIYNANISIEILAFSVDNQISSNIPLIEEPPTDSFSEYSEEILSNKQLIHVAWDREKAELSYTVYSTDLAEGAREWDQKIPRNVQEIIDLKFWGDLNIIFRDSIPLGNPSEEEWTSICLTLQGMGRTLFDQLVPLEVATQIKNWESGLSVIFSTTEEWIPWELMYDGQDFLGDKFILIRYPRAKRGSRARVTDPAENKNTQRKLKKIKRIVNVVGGNIKPRSEADRACNLFNYLPDSIDIEPIHEQSISILERNLAEADILHFTCHGHFKPLHLLQNHSGSSSVQNLCIRTVQNLNLKYGSFVFANACTSTTPVQAFSEFTSFGLEFYLQGADIFIGTLGIIPTEYAITFADNVYRELLLQENGRITVGQAIASAKQKAKDNKHNFFWLLYCIYGNPDCYFEPIVPIAVN